MKKQVLLAILSILVNQCFAQKSIYVATTGNDNNKGEINSPYKTLNAAVKKAYFFKNENIKILLRKGTYQIEKPVKILAADFTLSSLQIEPYQNEKVVFSGAKQLKLKWKPYRNGIYEANLMLTESIDRLFLNGSALPMARFPNFDSTAHYFNGTASNAIDKERIARWNDPKGGFIHTLHSGEWGGFHFLITGKTKDELTYIGGWQNNRPSPMHKEYRFVENIFEELDAPNEWFYDIKNHKLYFYPSNNVDLDKANFTASQLTDLIHIIGDSQKPVQNINIKNIDFTQTARSFMLTKEPLLRSDWTIYRGGAILLDGTANINISNCNFYELGGNAVFLSNYNKNNSITDNHIYNIGGNGILFVGGADAVRSPSFRYENFVPWAEMDFTKGPKNDNYPQHCSATGNLIHHIGLIEKQVAGAQISMAAYITVSHNSIYNVPRAGINISEGTWGGHLIEFNDVFNTVLETGDHGAFNSWGRDRYWSPNNDTMDSIVAARPGIEYLDVIDPIILRNNRFQCDHGWDIDLDDGSSNYLIYNNVCLSGGLKLREGYHRTVTNNIIINNTFHPHVWLANSDDIFTHNIVSTPYAPIRIKTWGKLVDSNFFLSQKALNAAQILGLDKNSLTGDAFFVDVASGNYNVNAESPALKIGFKNFKMDFGVTSPRLKKLANKPQFKRLEKVSSEKDSPRIEWLGAVFKNVETLGERSSAGLHNLDGALLISVSSQSLAAKQMLQKGDVIIALSKEQVNSITDLFNLSQKYKHQTQLEITLIRNQQEKTIWVNIK